MEESLIASFGDAQLYKSDLETLNNPTEYLTDNVISIFLEILTAKSPSTYCVSPEVVQLMKLSPPSELTEMFGGLDLPQYELVMFPVNNSEDFTNALSGSHWSLLIHIKQDKSFYHIDSCNNLNAKAASKLTKKLSYDLLKGTTGQCQALNCTQQTNGYDCGVFVVYFARLISKSFNELKRFDSKIVQQIVPGDYRSTMRTDCLVNIVELAEDQIASL